MGAEAAVSETAQVPIEAVNEVDKSILHAKENGNLDKESGPNEAIKFGSHEREVEKGDGSDVANSNLPRDVLEEWPAPKQIHYFYFVKFRPYDDPKNRAKREQADNEIAKKNQVVARINDRIRAKKDDREKLIAESRELKIQGYELNSILGEKRKEMQPLQQALGQLRNNNGAGRVAICSSEKELNDLIKSMHYRIQHESIPLSEEKQIIREIKQLEGTREKVIANAAIAAKIQESLGHKEDIQDQVKHMRVDLGGVRKENEAIWSKVNNLEEKIKAFSKEIKAIEEEREAARLKVNEAFASRRKLMEQLDGENSLSHDSHRILNLAKQLAASKDVKALEQLSKAEGDKFMSLFCNDKAVRDDYEKRILTSLDMRQLSRDGRIRNPGEKPIVAYETPVPSQQEPVAKAVKKPEEPKPAPKKEALPGKKTQKETSSKGPLKSAASEQVENVEEEEVAGLEKMEKASSSAEKKAEEAKLKELKREEEITKAKQAMERKRKLAEKAAAKAAKRAEKEAEKKLKEREKKLKKKTGASAPANEEEKAAAEEVVEGSEPESGETKEAAAPIRVKEQVRKEKPVVRNRNRGARGPESLPRALLKKKKSTNYWLWAAPAAVVVVLLVLLGYYYLL